MSASEENTRKGKGFVVIDRRGSADESEQTEEQEPQQTQASPDAAAPQEPASRELPRIDFSTFILSLSTSALYHLGFVADPETGKPAESNLALARQTIDTLEVLQEKTQGNLEEDERKLLENLLYELRMRFVESSRSSSS
jgi:hypothetical protein